VDSWASVEYTEDAEAIGKALYKRAEQVKVDARRFTRAMVNGTASNEESLLSKLWVTFPVFTAHARPKQLKSDKAKAAAATTSAAATPAPAAVATAVVHVASTISTASCSGRRDIAATERTHGTRRGRHTVAAHPLHSMHDCTRARTHETVGSRVGRQWVIGTPVWRITHCCRPPLAGRLEMHYSVRLRVGMVRGSRQRPRAW
jgi:hypothetical protein